jgi:hypothetical protein
MTVKTSGDSSHRVSLNIFSSFCAGFRTRLRLRDFGVTGAFTEPLTRQLAHSGLFAITIRVMPFEPAETQIQLAR